LQTGCTIVGQSLSATCFPGLTRKSLELIFILIFILSAMEGALFAPAY